MLRLARTQMPRLCPPAYRAPPLLDASGLRVLDVLVKLQLHAGVYSGAQEPVREVAWLYSTEYRTQQQSEAMVKAVFADAFRRPIEVVS